MKYKYSGYDRTARKVEGELEAESELDARNQLRAQSVRPLKLVPAEVMKVGKFTINLTLSSGAPSMPEFTAFIRQFATMQSAGIPIVQGLATLSSQVENRGFGRVLESVQKSIEEGSTLADALRKHPKVFDKIFVNLIAAGEMSGALERVMGRLAVYYEKAAYLRRKIVAAATYPGMILCLVTVVIIGLLYFVVPTFAEIFKGSGKALPEATQFIIDLSDWLKHNWYFVFGGIAGTVFGLVTAWKNEEVRKVIDPFLMKAPLFGDLIKKVSIARFSRTLATMIQSGVPILDALEITANVAGNYAVEAAIRKTRQSISEGNSISAPLAAAKIFPPMATSMIAIGEQSGALEQMLTKVAEFYEEEVDAKVTALTSILEPLMIVIVGSVVAGVLIPMYLPIFKMGDTVQ